jgi:Chlorophyllase enzyme
MRTWIGTAVVVACFAIGAGPAAARTTSGCPSVDGDWAGAGPFAVTTQQSGVGHTIYRPSRLGSRGCSTHPVVLWGNGTGTSPSYYDALLRHWASHGFIVAAANTSQAGSGQEMVAGLDYLAAQHQTPGSVFSGRVDTAHVAAAGHSQGGGGAINAGGDPRVGVTLPIQPSPDTSIENLHGPTFLLAGQFDFIVSPLFVRDLYERAAHVIALYGNLAGAHHGTPSGNGGGYRGPGTAWLRFQLMGDEQARGLFFGASCGYCTSEIWTEFLRNARAQAVPGP